MVVLLCATAQIQKDVQCPGARFPRLTHSQSIRVQETQSAAGDVPGAGWGGWEWPWGPEGTQEWVLSCPSQ